MHTPNQTPFMWFQMRNQIQNKDNYSLISNFVLYSFILLECEIKKNDKQFVCLILWLIFDSSKSKIFFKKNGFLSLL